MLADSYLGSLSLQASSLAPTFLAFVIMGKGEASTSNSSGSLATSVVDDVPSIVNPELERRARRKLDRNVLPVLTVFFFLSFLVCFRQAVT